MEHFADLFNTICFGGKSIIQCADLSEAPTELLHMSSKKRVHKTTSFYRDVVMKYHKSGITLALLTVENQSKIHYAMPIRSLFYDALSYHKQWRNLARKYKKTKELKEKEAFLSGMQKCDRFTPVISIVFYYGEEPWNWPKSLHDILDIPPGWEPYVKDYTLNLVDAGKCNLNFADTDNQDYFHLLSLLYDENISLKQRKQNVLDYCDHHPVTQEVLSTVCASSSNYEIKFGDDTNEGVTHVCKVFDAEREAGRVEGRAEEIIKIYQELKKSNDFILKKLKYSLQGTTQGRYLTGGVPPVRFSM